MKLKFSFAMTLALALGAAARLAEAAPPVITNVAFDPAVPSDTDSPWISATVTPASGLTLSQVQLTYNVNGGTPTTNTVFTETMGTTPVKPWSGATGSDHPWTVTGSYFELRTSANYVASTTDCGMEYKGSTTTNPLTSAMVAAAEGINAAGNSGHVEFYVKTLTLDGTDGWTFEVDSGIGYVTRLSELTGTSHAYQKYHYDLATSELVNGLKMRFQFTGGGASDTDDRIDIDQITVSVTSGGSSGGTLTMYDDGAHGDGSANDLVYGARIPPQISGSTVNFTISATDSNAATTTAPGSYTTGPAPGISTATSLPGSYVGAVYSQTLAASGGTGPSYSWNVNAGSTLPPGLALSSAGVLSGTTTMPGSYSFPITVTDSAGRIATKAFTLNVAATTRPNVLIVVTDDQGWGDVGYHTPPGQVPIQTPTLDSFATQGIRLERFYATTVCSVTRACLLTGRQTIRTGVNNGRGLDLSEHIMPQTFKAAGYQTFMVGKWHLGGSDKNLSYTTVNGQSVRIIQEGLEYAPYNRGWDSHYGQYSGAIDYLTHNSAEAENPDRPDWWLNGVQQDGPSEHTDSQGHGGWSPDLEADRAIDHIQHRDPSKPMLLYLAFNSIHGPVSAPPELISKYQSLGVTNSNRRLIAAAVDGMDTAFGRVLATLEAAGIADNTIVIWFGDNGGDETKGSLNDPLRGTKGDSYDGGLHEVAGIRWPGVLPAGVISNQPVWVGDIFPTICAAAGITPQGSKPLDGVNLWPALLAASNSTTVSRGSPLVTDQATPIAIYSFTDPVNGGTKEFKLIRNRVDTTTVNELFNLTDYPYETTDLLLGMNAAAYAGIVTSLTNAITAITPETYKPYIGPPLIANTAVQGSTITLYAPFTSYKTPAVQWRKNGANISGATGFTQVIDTLGASVVGAYTTTLTLTDVTPDDEAVYDVVVSNSAGSTTSEPGTLTVTNPTGPVIRSVSTGPTSPTYIDPVWVNALVSPPSGASLAQVSLTYNLGTPVTTKVLQEVFNFTSANNWNGSGALNPWTVTAVTANHVRQSVGSSNHTVPLTLSGCQVNGTTLVTCDSTANLWPGMRITGPNIPAADTIAQVNSSTSFTLASAATGSGSGLTLTAAGVTLTNCTTTSGSATVTCDSTVGLETGMSLSGTSINNNATVLSITSGTTFVMNASATASGTGVTLAAAGAAAEFQTGTANLTDSMFATTNTINTTSDSAYVEFYVQTRDLAATNNNQWTFQVSSGGGSTWNTRIGEDYNSKTVNLANCVLNPTESASGSTTITCASTTGVTTGMAVRSADLAVANCTTTTTGTPTVVGCPNTMGLVVGMFLAGAGIPNNARIVSITPNVSFTMSVAATAAGTVPIAANYLPSNAVVSAVSNATTLVLNVAAYANTSASPVALAASNINHDFRLYHYDLTSAERGANTALRFQFAGYSPTSPIRAPRVDIDDIVIATTATPQPVTVAMVDDGQHGDGAAGDGVYGALIPVQPGGTSVTFQVSARDSNGATSIAPGSGSYSYSVNPALTDATIKSAEFLGIPTSSSVTVNVVAATDQYAFVEYGTAPGSYTEVTPETLFAVDAAKPDFYNPIEIPITGLQADTEYYYRFRYRDTAATLFNARGERSFHTARPRGSSFIFTVTADPHLDVMTDVPLFSRAMANILADGPDLHIDLGDIFMTDKLADGVTGVPAQFGGGVFPNQSRLNDRALMLRGLFEQSCHSIPFFYILGNHEAEYGYLFNAASDKENNIPAWDLKARKSFFPTPVPDSFYTGNATPKDYSGGSLGLLEDYYAWEWGDALFIVLDPYWNTVTNPVSSQNAWSWSLGKTQYDWLKLTLQNSSAKYKFVFTHHIVGGTWTLADGVTSQCAGRGGVEVAPYFEWGGKNVDGTDGFAANRPGWDMPIHQLLVQNHVNIVFHGHDHFYGCQTLDGIIYLECPQPGTPNYTALGSAAEGKYTTGVILPNSGHIRVTVNPDRAVAEYVRAYRSSDESATVHNRDISHSFTIAPRIHPPVEMLMKSGTTAAIRWNAVPNKTYSIQWSTDLVNWTTLDTVTLSSAGTNGSYTDTNASHFGQAGFYRISYTP